MSVFPPVFVSAAAWARRQLHSRIFNPTRYVPHTQHHYLISNSLYNLWFHPILSQWHHLELMARCLDKVTLMYKYDNVEMINVLRQHLMPQFWAFFITGSGDFLRGCFSGQCGLLFGWEVGTGATYYFVGQDCQHGSQSWQVACCLLLVAGFPIAKEESALLPSPNQSGCRRLELRLVFDHFTPYWTHVVRV